MELKSLLSLSHVINSKYKFKIYKFEYFLAAMLVSIVFKTPLTKYYHEMKLGLQNYAVIMTTENRCITFNTNKLNSLHRYDTA
jgi:hypothetical protein